MGRRYDYSGDTETVGLDVDAVEAETDKALLLSFPDIGESIWTPKSQIHNLEELEDGLARGGDVGSGGVAVVGTEKRSDIGGPKPTGDPSLRLGRDEA